MTEPGALRVMAKLLFDGLTSRDPAAMSRVLTVYGVPDPPNFPESPAFLLRLAQEVVAIEDGFTTWKQAMNAESLVRWKQVAGSKVGLSAQRLASHQGVALSIEHYLLALHESPDGFSRVLDALGLSLDATNAIASASVHRNLRGHALYNEVEGIAKGLSLNLGLDETANVQVLMALSHVFANSIDRGIDFPSPATIESELRNFGSPPTV